jgi:hypothetical protein
MIAMNFEEEYKMTQSRFIAILIIICATSIALALPPGGAGSSQKTHRGFYGKITDENGKTLTGVEITLFNVDPNHVDEVRSVPEAEEKKSLSTTTRANGGYRFVAVRPGIYRVRYELSGYQTLEKLVEFRRGSKDAVMNIKLKELTETAQSGGDDR